MAFQTAVSWSSRKPLRLCWSSCRRAVTGTRQWNLPAWAANTCSPFRPLPRSAFESRICRRITGIAAGAGSSVSYLSSIAGHTMVTRKWSWSMWFAAVVSRRGASRAYSSLRIASGVDQTAGGIEAQNSGGLSGRILWGERPSSG